MEGGLEKIVFSKIRAVGNEEKPLDLISEESGGFENSVFAVPVRIAKDAETLSGPFHASGSLR